MQGIWLVGLPLVNLGTVKITSLYVWNIITLYTLAVRPVILAEAFCFSSSVVCHNVAQAVTHCPSRTEP